MSLHITLYNKDCVVMASDSRITLRRYRRGVGGLPELTGAETQDGVRKLFRLGGCLGISLSGQLDICGEDILEHIAHFSEICSCRRAEAAAVELLEYFGGRRSDTCFHIAGRDGAGQSSACRLMLKSGRIEPMNCRNRGVIYNGDVAVAERLLRYEGLYVDFSSPETMAAAARYLIGRTGEELPPQDGVCTVGGPISVLMIDGSGIRWDED